MRAGADPNYINKGHDLTLFWGIDGGVEIMKLLHQYGANLDTRCHTIPAHTQLQPTFISCSSCIVWFYEWTPCI